MKTTYLDNEIILLEGYKKDGTIRHYQNRKLAEYKKIKKLLLHDVVFQKEQLCEHKNKTQHFSDVFGRYESCLDCGKDL
jgi:hypothetical protein